MIRCGITMLCILVALNSSATGKTQHSKNAMVVITFGDGLGTRLQGGSILSFKNRETGQELASRFHNDKFFIKAIRIPFGSYEIRVVQPGFPDSVQPVEISEGEVYLDICLRTAVVHIIDIGRVKHDPSKIEVKSLTRRPYGADFGSSFEGNTAAKIPYGSYDLNVTAHPYGALVQRPVEVYQPEVWVLVSLGSAVLLLADGGVLNNAAPENLAPTVIVRGIVNNMHVGDGPIYVSLVGVYDGFEMDDRVIANGTSGTFSLAGANTNAGMEVLLIITGRNGILDIRHISSIPMLKQPIVIDLEQAHPPA